MEALDNIKVSTKVETTSSDSKIEIQNNKKTKEGGMDQQSEGTQA